MREDGKRTHPAALLGDPLRDLLDDDEATDEADDLGEEAADASLQGGDGHAVAEAQQRDDAAPVDVSAAKQPANQEKTISVGSNRQKSAKFQFTFALEWTMLDHACISRHRMCSC